MKDNQDHRLGKYDISDFDEKMNLKFGAVNTLLLVYLISPIIISFICSSSKGNSGLQILKASYISKDIMYVSLFGTIPVVIFIISFLLNKPAFLFNKIKRHGKALMMTSATVNVFIWTYVLLHIGYKANVFHILSILLSSLSLFYIIKSKYLKDYFITKIPH
mgnify:CR=1 FL=1|tara:strand:- start:9380 stop:9865 length:486 start_codon:yes stop_codon:yes gene_type:complete